MSFKAVWTEKNTFRFMSVFPGATVFADKVIQHFSPALDGRIEAVLALALGLLATGLLHRAGQATGTAMP